MMPKYRFLSQLCGDFVPVFYILLYTKEILFICVIHGATLYRQRKRDIPDFLWLDSHTPGAI